MKKLITGTLAAIAWLPIGMPYFATTQELPKPIMIAMPRDGRLTVRLVNNTDAVVTYQAVRDTGLRDLEPGMSANLLNLRTPINLTFSYQDATRNPDVRAAMIQAVATIDSKTGTLEVVLQPTVVPQLERSVVSVDPNGSVFIY